jgi:3-oxoacyl-[acyl-carrier-protein] synthase II
MGALTPVGNTVSEFWHSLSEGTNGIDEIKSFDTQNMPFKLGAEIKNFNAAERLDKMTARKNDPYVLYALCAAKEAMEDSGLEGKIDGSRIGVYFGSGIGGMQTLCQEHASLLAFGPRKVTPQFIPKMISNIAAGAIAIRYQATGPNMAVSTACATGSTAIGEAFRAIGHGYADAMLCGGSEAAITPLTVAGFGNCLALTASADKNAASLPFDKRRAGFVIGEGAAALVLEEYEHAVKRGAPIYAEVAGYGSTCDAYHITAPSPDAAATARAITLAAAECGSVHASQIYINAHGTGTPMNDKTETLAFKNAFGGEAYMLHISSTKSMTGHMLGAAGAAEAIACIKALQHQTIPPTINLSVPDEECDLDYTPNTALKTQIDLALSTSLGFGGHNACLAFRMVS